jgi:hypothetical protein
LGWAGFPCNKCLQGHARCACQGHQATRPRIALASVLCHLPFAICDRISAIQKRPAKAGLAGAYLRNKSRFVLYCCSHAAGLSPGMPYGCLGTHVGWQDAAGLPRQPKAATLQDIFSGPRAPALKRWLCPWIALSLAVPADSVVLALRAAAQHARSPWTRKQGVLTALLLLIPI